jgi:hypothetical protein
MNVPRRPADPAPGYAGPLHAPQSWLDNPEPVPGFDPTRPAKGQFRTHADLVAHVAGRRKKDRKKATRRHVRKRVGRLADDTAEVMNDHQRQIDALKRQLAALEQRPGRGRVA